jgi:hypothetical protein
VLRAAECYPHTHAHTHTPSPLRPLGTISPSRPPRTRTSQEGWELLSSNAEVWRCYDSSWDERYYSDSGASLAVMAAGWSMDTLLTKYQGVDWWNRATWRCNAK